MAKRPMAPSGTGKPAPARTVVGGKPTRNTVDSQIPPKGPGSSSVSGTPKTQADDAQTCSQGSVSGGTFYGDGSGRALQGQQEGE
jgi:hypothetical protein